MNMKNTLLAVCAFAASLAVAAPADDTARLSEIGAEQIKIQNETRGLVEGLNHDLRSEKYDTPEMQALRARIAELQQQIRDAEKELRNQFEQLPEVRERVKTVNANFARLRDLHDERTKIEKARAPVQKPAEPQPEEEQAPAEEPAAEQPAPAEGK